MSARASSLLRALLVLLAGARLCGAAERTEAKFQEDLEKFVHRPDQDWERTFPEALAELVGEVAQVTHCGEAIKAALVADTGPLTAKIMDHWHRLYRAYYLAHRDSTADTVWDDYADLIAGDASRKGVAALNAEWQGLLRARLTPEQMALWQAEQPRRRQHWAAAGATWLDKRLAVAEKPVRKDFETRAARLVRSAEVPKERAGAFESAAVAAAIKAYREVESEASQRVLAAWGDNFIYVRASRLKTLEDGTYSGYHPREMLARRKATEAFDATVQKLLLPAEQARIGDRPARLRKRIDELVKDLTTTTMEEGRAEFQTMQKKRLDGLVADLGLEEPRRLVIKAALDKADAAVLADWAKDFTAFAIKEMTTKTTNNPDAEELLKHVEDGSYPLMNEETAARVLKARDEAWSRTIAALVKPEELARLKVAEIAATARRTRVLAEVAVEEMDHRLLLLPEQRTAIEKLALEAAAPIAALPEEVAGLWQQTLSNSLLLVHAIGVPKVEALLQESQKKDFHLMVQRWKSAWTQIERLLPKKS